MALSENWVQVEKARRAAIEVLVHNSRGPCEGLPRTAGWGYPEPYTRDMMLCLPGVLVSGNTELIAVYKRVLETLAENQSPLGHIPSLVHNPEDRGSSDCTPLFLIGASLYRKAVNDGDFLAEAVQKAATWMQYQSPSDRSIAAQLPTSDWRDEMWVLGYGLYLNTLVYTYLKLFGDNERAGQVKREMSRFGVTGSGSNQHVHEGLAIPHKPYYMLWSYKIYSSERFDLLGNSLAILSGIASANRAAAVALWIEDECSVLREKNELASKLPPNLFPYIQPSDPDWLPRYKEYNPPGHYHNGGIWPFICGLYVAALVAAGKPRIARAKLYELTRLVRSARNHEVEFGFNEWLSAYDGLPRGQDWQSWSAAMYLYAAACVERSSTPFFDEVRNE